MGGAEHSAVFPSSDHTVIVAIGIFETVDRLLEGVLRVLEEGGREGGKREGNGLNLSPQNNHYPCPLPPYPQYFLNPPPYLVSMVLHST